MQGGFRGVGCLTKSPVATERTWAPSSWPQQWSEPSLPVPCTPALRLATPFVHSAKFFRTSGCSVIWRACSVLVHAEEISSSVHLICISLDGHKNFLNPSGHLNPGTRQGG